MTRMRANLSWQSYHLAVSIGDYEKALETAKAAVRHYVDCDDLKHAGIWQRAISSTLLLMGDYEEATEQARRSLRMQPDPYEKGLSLIVIANIQTFAGRYRSAFLYFGRALKIALRFPDDIYMWCHLYGNRAIAYRRTGKLDKAIVDWEGSAELLRRHQQLWRAAQYVNNIGFLLAMGGHLKEAEQRVLQALELVEQDPHEHTEAVIYDSLGYVYTLMRQFVDAERFLKRSAKIFEQTGGKAELIGTLLHLAELHVVLKHYETARVQATRALELANELNVESLRTQSRECLESLLRTQLEDDLNERFNGYRWLRTRPGSAR